MFERTVGTSARLALKVACHALILIPLLDNHVSASVAVVPKPNQMSVDETAPPFLFTSSTRILFEAGHADLQQVGGYLHTLLSTQIPGLGAVQPHGGGAQPSGTVLLTTAGSDASLGDEGYELEANASQITIRALDRTGAFYAVQTLRQLLPVDIERPAPVPVSWSVPQASIQDKPALRYRGYMLDVSRTFFPKRYLLRQIDLMALHKNNVFHLHLADDQGWRMESLVYPSLHETAAFWDPSATDIFGEGYYTQQELNEIVEFAAERNIEIIPEVDLPAHSLALLHALPELACNQPRYASEFPVLPWEQWGVTSHEPVCPAPEANYDILGAALEEVAALFPSPFFHAGNDEVMVLDGWNSSPEVAALRAQEGLHSNAQVHAYFSKRVEEILNASGKTLIAWNERSCLP